MQILNLGCGTKISANPSVVNIDWSITLRLQKNPVLRKMVLLTLQGERRKRFASLSDNVMVCNLANGIPFASDSVDAVYHSHMLEHLDRNVAPRFLAEAKRVLKAGRLAAHRGAGS